MSKCYNIVFYGSDADEEFQFDWTVLPEGKYKLYFELTGNFTGGASTDIPAVFLNLGCNTNSYIVSTKHEAKTSHFLGLLHKDLTDPSTMFCGKNEGQPLYLDSRPSNPSTQVIIKYQPTSSNSPNTYIGDYILKLHLLEVKDTYTS